MPDKIQSIISKMTLEEKAALCTGATPWTTTPIERLGVPELTMADGPHGVRRVAEEETLIASSHPATCFPTASCMAATWDADLIGKVGQAIAEECIAQKVDVILGPGVNMKRTPLCGRNFEYYSEDPFLAGELGASFIVGVQSKGVGTSLKHFATNNQEYQRLTISSEMDERTLREIYLPAFETAVKKAQPWTVMCAYNKLNGTYCSENHKLLVEILEDEWNFEGLVVSDWSAVHDRVVSLEAGLDLEMPGPREFRVKAVIDAVRSGSLEESILDEAVLRILRIVFKAAETKKGVAFDMAAHHALARRVAADGIVLLKNNGILPLKGQQHIAVIGLSAQQAYIEGGGSSHVNPTMVDVPFAELQKASGDAELTYSQGYKADESFNQEFFDEAVKNAEAGDVALLYISLPETMESEGYDREDLNIPRQQVDLIKAVCQAQPNTVIILNSGAPVVMHDWIESPAAIIEAWMMGQAGGGAIADVLFGKVNPSGKLAETFPLKLVDTPAYINYPGENGTVRYGEGIFIGYRYYDAKEVPVQFPFGHGLSFTTFDYTNPRVSATAFKDVDGLTVSVDVTNTGKVAGKEVVQVYIHDQKSDLARPPKELKGFAKVELQPGETKTVHIQLDFRSFAYFHSGYMQWITEDGEYDILIGASSADIRCTQTVSLLSSLVLPSLLNHDSTLRDWMEDKRGREVLAPHLPQIMRRIHATMGGEESDVIGMDPDGFMMDMPLSNILDFHHDNISPLPEDLVNKLLSQVHGSD